MSILEVHDVSIRYMTGDFKDIGLKEYLVRRLQDNYHVNEFWADKNISFSLEKGDMLGIIGTNGAGKSTLLKVISGIMEPTGGWVKREGNIAALLELGSGFDSDLTVRENTYLRGAMLGYTRKFMEERYDKIIEFAELKDFQDRPFKQLSSGMKSRLAFSIASLVQPDILILDEVLSVGDGAFRKKSEAKMREIISGGATTILVSHSLKQVRAMCSKVLWLEKGRQIAFGDAAVLCGLYQQYLNHAISLEEAKAAFSAAKNQNDAIEGGNNMRQTKIEKGSAALTGSAFKDKAVKMPGEDAGRKEADVSMRKRGRKNTKRNNLSLDKKKRIGRFLVVYTILFLITFLLAYSPFLLEGKTLIWTNSDGRTQHYPTLVYIGRYLRQIVLNLLHGEIAVPLFDLNLAMGSDVIATLNYYGFGNPLYLLSAFVPTHYTEYLFNVLVVLRIYLAGLAFSGLCAYHKKPLPHALAGALMYAFSGYVIYSATRHPYFMEPMIQLPLLLIGIDQVIRRKKPTVFILSVFYSALCGFYFLYMMTLMLGVYTLIRFFDCYEKERIKEFFLMAGRIAGTYLMGLGLAAPLFIPAVVGLLSSDRSGVTVARDYFSYGWTYYRNYTLRLIAPTASWDSLSLAAIALPAAVFLLTQRKKHRSLKLLLAACVVVYVLPLGGYIMNGFSYPSQRWTFGAALLLSYIVVEMLPTLLDLNRSQQAVCLLTLLVYSGCVFVGASNRSINYVVGAAMLAVTLFALLWIKNARHGQSSQKLSSVGAVVCVLLVIANVSVNAVFRFAKDQGNAISEFEVCGAETGRLESAIEREAEPYLEKNDGRFDGSSFSYNVGAVWRVPTMKAYWSIVNENVSDFYLKTENADQRDSSHTFAGTNGRTGINALLSTKYFLEKADRAQYTPYGYSLLKKTGNENLIYENQYALPWGYTYEKYISYDSMESMNGLQAEEAMLQAIALENDIEMIPSGLVESNLNSLTFEITELKNVKWNDGVLTVSKDNAVITLEFQMPAGVEGYLRLEKFDINHSGQSKFLVTAKCEGISRTMSAASTDHSWYYGRENYLVNLGYSDEERTSCTITFPKKGTYRLADIQLFALPMDKYPEQVEALRAEPLENIEVKTNRITGTVDLSKNKILCMSIPYSSGWTARVDGEKVDILRGNYMFMALPLEAGRHEIEFTYCTPGLRAGLVCCLISAGCLAYLAIQERRKKESLT